MANVDPKLIMERAEKYRDYAAGALSNLIKIKSTSGAEEDVVMFLDKEFRTSGAHEVVIDNFGNIIARIGSRGPVIAFDAHIDTVDVGDRDRWSFDPFSGEIKDGRVHGRGASDQKAGMASMLAALRIISAMGSDLPFTIFFVGSVFEEDCDGLCWQYIVKEDKIRPDIVIITEPTDNKINRGQRGRMEMEIVVSGLSCHGSAPERGKNAIYKLAPIIAAVEKLNDNLITDTFLGKGTLAATRIRSNSPSLNAVADMACLYIDRRLTQGETPETAKAELEALLEVQVAEAKVEVPVFDKLSWRGTIYPTLKTYPAWVLPENHHLIDYARQCHQKLFDVPPVIDKWTFSTNGVATMGLLNIPTFGFGPGQEKMAHAPNESVAIDDIVRCAAFYSYFPWLVVGQ
ncbi:MAG TPA: YgeY family selenium metabolism-linked hydrolase [candidate division Zixibacteria bacterium]|nr:YgeY family selenium metabolism-linked hydrolase [candidate division Zixibacteria bacterium]